MAGKNIKLKNAILIGALSLLLGFLLGEFLPLPFFQDVNLMGTMSRPGDAHRRQGF